MRCSPAAPAGAYWQIYCGQVETSLLVDREPICREPRQPPASGGPVDREPGGGLAHGDTLRRGQQVKQQPSHGSRDGTADQAGGPVPATAAAHRDLWVRNHANTMTASRTTAPGAARRSPPPIQ